jgi:cytochrome c
MKSQARVALVLATVLAACGGKSKPATPPDPTPTDTTGSAAGSAAETPPEEKKAPEPDPGALAAAALAEQYDAGKKVYGEKDCDSCHGDNGEGNPKTPAVIGLDKALPEKPAKTAKLRKGVTFKTADDVAKFIKAKMPIKTPGTLTDDETYAVTAWILSESKVNITAKLDASNAASINLR